MLLCVAVWTLEILEDNVLISEDLEHALHEAMVELLGIVLINNISITRLVDGRLTALPCGVS